MGACADRHHESCPYTYQRWYVGPVGKGRKKKNGVIYLDEWRVCDCSCHPENKAKKKTTKKTTRRKK